MPDLRYMPRSIPTVQQPTTILTWLANGPSQWLSDQVRELEPGTSAPDNVPAIANDTLQVKLSSQAVQPGDGKQLDLLRRQLQWSLGPLLPRTLELQIGHEDPVPYSGTDFQSSNAAFRLAQTPQRFLLFNGVVRRKSDDPRAGEPVPVLKPAENKGISRGRDGRLRHAHGRRRGDERHRPRPEAAGGHRGERPAGRAQGRRPPLRHARPSGLGGHRRRRRRRARSA